MDFFPFFPPFLSRSPLFFLFAVRCYASAALAVMRCLCVCPSPSGSHTILIFLYQTAWQYSDGTPPPLTGTFNTGGVGRNQDSQPISGFIACCERCDSQLLSTRLSADTRLSIDACCSVLSTEVRPSSGVSQSRCKSVVYGTETEHDILKTNESAEVAGDRNRSHALVKLRAQIWLQIGTISLQGNSMVD